MSIQEKQSQIVKGVLEKVIWRKDLHLCFWSLLLVIGGQIGDPAKKLANHCEDHPTREKGIHLAVKVVNMSIRPSSWNVSWQSSLRCKIVSVAPYPSCNFRSKLATFKKFMQISWGWIYQGSCWIGGYWRHCSDMHVKACSEFRFALFWKWACGAAFPN